MSLLASKAPAPRRRRGNGRHIGGFTPSTPTATAFASKPEAVCVALMKTSFPLATRSFVPGRKVTIGAVGGTSTSSRPPLYVTTRWVTPPCDRDAATSPLVIVLFTFGTEVET